MRGLLICALLALTACATAPKPAPEPVIRTVEVKVPIPIPCRVKVEENGPLPSDGKDLAALDIFELAKLALQDVLELKARLTTTEAAARACSS